MASARWMVIAHHRQEAAMIGGPLAGSLMPTAIVGVVLEFWQQLGVYEIVVRLRDAFFATK